MTQDNRTFRPERFISSGDEAFQDDWEILESEEDSNEAEANLDDSADDRQLATETHPPYSGAKSAAQALHEIASQFGFGAKGRG